ncbi:type II toxin-antitoxin system RelE/ParE family toxin [Oleomonas cavernae]|uniref:Type II toxin-antitoxin system RelE/ParE family toxin n=1 Tax=Oleomonas cavernae TaxID=2320859 RepID=A0A418W9I2_9PROT|nr:type II toxin-antitoxin system RelE/ParE family toxin [Oleomonas cavernae]RJF86594.1 type II toxin-antitoxin system RelE/ParE family toxin [Oleomonas cavernae]
MRRAIWTKEARADWYTQIEYVGTKDPFAAELIANRVLDAVHRLAEMPTGRRGRVEGTYEKSVRGTRLIVAYALVDDPTEEDGGLVILHIIHTARDWPAGQWPK